MNKYLLGITTLISTLLSPAIAEETKNIYLTVGGGLAFPNDTKGDTTLGGTKYDVVFPKDNTTLYSIGIGKEFNDFRLEFNYSAATVESDSITVKTGGSGVTASVTPNLEADVNSFMIYGLKDFAEINQWKPYAGIGLGYATLSAKDQTATVSGSAYSLKGSEESVFSFALKLGANYEIKKNTSLYTEATYQNFSSYNVSEPGYETVNYDPINFFGIIAGLKFNF